MILSITPILKSVYLNLTFITKIIVPTGNADKRKFYRLPIGQYLNKNTIAGGALSLAADRIGYLSAKLIRFTLCSVEEMN